MTIASNLERIINAKAAIKAAIIEKGVEVPDEEKLDTYYSYIDQIGSTPPPKGDNTLNDLLLALATDNPHTTYPANSVIVDTWNGQPRNWVVGHYGDATLPNGDTTTGVYLFREIVDPASQQWGNNGSNYANSAANSYLNSTYLQACSDELKGIINEIAVPTTNGAVNAKIFLMSDYEVCASGSGIHEGVMWDAWRERTGLDSPSDKANEGRIMRTDVGTDVKWWTRTNRASSNKDFIEPTGAGGNGSPTQQLGIVAACFIAKSASGGGDNPPIVEPDLSGPLDAAGLKNLQNIVAAGKASEYLKTGDEIKVSYSTYTMPFEIVGFEPVEIEGGKTVPAINLLAKYTNTTDIIWSSDINTIYSGSALRDYIIGEDYQGRFDSGFISCLANTKVQTYNRDGSVDVAYDKLFAPSMAEIGVTNTIYNSPSQAAVEGPAFVEYQRANDAMRIKRAINATSTAQYYWTRTLFLGKSGYCGYVGTSGYTSSDPPNTTARCLAACNFIGN